MVSCRKSRTTKGRCRGIRRRPDNRCLSTKAGASPHMAGKPWLRYLFSLFDWYRQAYKAAIPGYLIDLPD